MHYIKKYYPESMEAPDDSALRDRRIIQDFMEGELDVNLRNQIESSVRNIVKEEDISVVCFIPGSTRAKTILRFGELSSELSFGLECDVYLDAITLKADADPITHEVFYHCKPERVKGKNVLIIGGVCTHEQHYASIARLVLEQGAEKVEGLYVAKTVN